MSVAFWSVKLVAGAPKIEVQPPEGFVLTITLAALEGGNKGSSNAVKINTISIDGEPAESLMCTLRPEQCEQFACNLVIGYDVPTHFSLTGKTGTVHLSGYFQPAPEDCKMLLIFTYCIHDY